MKETDGLKNDPVGFAIDKSPVPKFPWDPDSALQNSVAKLRILVTSGQLCSHHLPVARAPAKSAPVSIAQKPDSNRMEPPKAPAPSASSMSQQVQPGSSQSPATAPPKEDAKKRPGYDDSAYLMAYYEEQAKFERELKNRLDPVLC
ncbi:hypothetical protein QAD02_007749 [Eretmocerus hayati]|uniref:Uncharacterized protein n=1 Tax=Eretmocerus hayati TaxID=131215 RepID=A0ACC2N6Z4_9HYME|nr:hypothetical protein QAD02_007749 [Eretmocerus hayati]